MNKSEEINYAQKVSANSAAFASIVFAFVLLWNIACGAFPHGSGFFAGLMLIFPAAILWFSVALLRKKGNPDALTKSLQASVSSVFSLLVAYFAFAALYAGSNLETDKEILEAFMVPMIALAIIYAFPYYATKHAANLVEVENK